MTDTGSIFQTPRGSVGLRGIGDTCPDSETLSAYLDGRLEAAARAPIDDHISRCEDCYFIVRETSGVWAGAEAEANPDAAVAVTPQEVQRPDNVVSVDGAVRRAGETPSRTRQSFITRYVLPMAATLIVGAGSVAVWRQAHFVQNPRAGLVAAVGERRFFDARLTGGFKYGERISPKRGSSSAVLPTPNGGAPQPGASTDPNATGMRSATGPATEDWEILAAAAKIKKDFGNPKTAEDRATLASAHLVLGEVDQAVRLFELALKDPESADGRNAKLLSDLAAAYLTRAMNDDRPDDYPRALERASQATELDPTLREALFNRAVCLEHLFLTTQAIKAWDAFLINELDPAWRQEATRRRDALTSRASPDFSKIERDTKGAVNKGTDEQLDIAVGANIGVARDVFELDLLPSVDSDPRSAERLAASFSRVTRDPYAEVAVRQLLLAPSRADQARRFARARRAYDRGEWSAAQPLFQEVASTLGVENPLGLWSKLHLLILRFQKDSQTVRAQLLSLAHIAKDRGFGLIEGRALWVLALSQLDAGEFDLAESSDLRAMELFKRAGHLEWLGFMSSQISEIQALVGDDDAAAASRLTALAARQGFRDPLRRRAVLLSAAEYSTDGHRPSTALSFLDELEAEETRMGLAVRSRSSLARHRARALALVSKSEALRQLEASRRHAAGIHDSVWREREFGETTIDLALAMAGAPGSEPTIVQALAWADSRAAESAKPALFDALAKSRLASGDIGGARTAALEGIASFEARLARKKDFRLTQSDRAWNLYSTLLETTLKSGATPGESIVTAERVWQSSFGGGLPHRRVTRRNPIRTSLPPGAGVLGFVTTEKDVWMWLVTDGGTRQFHATVSADFESLREAIHKAAFREDLHAFDQAGRQLCQAILSAAWPSLKGLSRVVVIPHGRLADIPLGALPCWERRLQESFVLSFAPTLEFALQSVKPMHRSELIAVGAAKQPGSLALPAADQELRVISKLYETSVVLSGEKATVEALGVHMTPQSVVHFATHALVTPRQPLLSGLEMSGHPRWLRPFQESSLRWRPDQIVVLSVCAGSHAGSQAAYPSLARGLLSKGILAVVASHYPLADGAPQGVMVRFHEALRRTLSPVLALHEALGQPGIESPTLLSLAVFAPLDA